MEKFINIDLLKQPMNWAVVFLIATLWLLAFHVIMQGFMGMQGASFSNGPLPNGSGIAPQVGDGSSLYSQYS